MSIMFAINKKPVFYINKYIVNIIETKKDLPKDTVETYAMLTVDRFYITRLLTKYSNNYTKVVNNKLIAHLTICLNVVNKLIQYRYYRLDQENLQLALRVVQQHTTQSVQ